jgi:hypothetical protein
MQGVFAAYEGFVFVHGTYIVLLIPARLGQYVIVAAFVNCLQEILNLYAFSQGQCFGVRPGYADAGFMNPAALAAAGAFEMFP